MNPDLNLNKTKLMTAVAALGQVSQKVKTGNNLTEDVDVVQLHICVKKIPSKDKTFKLKLPHSLRGSSTDVCLFVKDLDKTDRDYEPTVVHFKDFLRKKGIKNITEVIPLKSLKTEYKPFEAKRNLSNAYEVFLADACIIRLLPTYLGKHFYGKNKAPVQVNLQAKNLAKEIDTAINTTISVITSKGSSSTVPVGNIDMSHSDIVENILEAVKQIATALPGGTANIKQLSLKTQTSLSIPIFLSEGGPQDISIPKERQQFEAVEPEEVSTLLDAKVQVLPDGRVFVLKDGKRVLLDGKPKRQKRLPKKSSGPQKRKQKSQK